MFHAFMELCRTVVARQSRRRFRLFDWCEQSACGDIPEIMEGDHSTGGMQAVSFSFNTAASQSLAWTTPQWPASRDENCFLSLWARIPCHPCESDFLAS